MNTVNLGPNTPVPKTGIYYCTTCKDIPKAIRAVASEAGLDQNVLEQVMKARGVGAGAPVTRQRFKAGSQFGVCPRHKNSTGWTLEKEELDEKKWWQFWK